MSRPRRQTQTQDTHAYTSTPTPTPSSPALAGQPQLSLASPAPTAATATTTGGTDSDAATTMMAHASVQYTAFIRLPFPRGDFVDPPLVNWDASKDRDLWKTLSMNPKSTDIDWASLASEFGVTVPFILQQAAWLYERQLSQVRAQMRRVSKSNAPSPAPMQPRGLEESAKRPSFEDVIRRTPTRVRQPLEMQGAGAAVKFGDSTPTTPTHPRSGAPAVSRNPSTNTVVQVRSFRESNVQGKQRERPQQSSHEEEEMETASPPRRDRQAEDVSSTTDDDDDSSSSESSSSSSSSDDSKKRPLRSRLFRRATRFQGGKPTFGKPTRDRNDGPAEPGERNEQEGRILGSGGGEGDDNDDDEEEEEDDAPAFLPYSNSGSEKSKSPQDLTATLRSPHTYRALSQIEGQHLRRAATDSSTSSASSAAVAEARADAIPGDAARSLQQQHHQTRAPPGALSPRQRAELAGMSPRRRPMKRDGSDGAPSMGSSFSDLDALDASVTQSALEEALLSNMQHGGMASRMSSISQALRSRYMPGSS